MRERFEESTSISNINCNFRKVAMLVKVCGMTSKQDINLCIDNNVDVVGFLLQPPSKSYARADMLDLKVAKELIAYVPKSMESCLLIHLKDITEILSVVEEIKPTMIQIQKQSQLSINNLKKLKEKFPNIKITKTFYVYENIDILTLVNDIKFYIDSQLIDFILLDSEKGGSGEIHNWDISAQVIKEVKDFPTFLAGGLNQDNISSAISQVKPYGVDVMSGVSTELYNKDQNKVKSFLENANKTISPIQVISATVRVTGDKG